MIVVMHGDRPVLCIMGKIKARGIKAKIGRYARGKRPNTTINRWTWYGEQLIREDYRGHVVQWVRCLEQYWWTEVPVETAT